MTTVDDKARELAAKGADLIKQVGALTTGYEYRALKRYVTEVNSLLTGETAAASEAPGTPPDAPNKWPFMKGDGSALGNSTLANAAPPADQSAGSLSITESEKRVTNSVVYSGRVTTGEAVAWRIKFSDGSSREWQRIEIPPEKSPFQEYVGATIEYAYSSKPPSAAPDGERFQAAVAKWMVDCFGLTIPFDVQERNHRFIEESLELVRACGMPKQDAYALVDYVYGRQVGEAPQEVGGVMVTLAALCHAHGMSMQGCGDSELDRITKPDIIEKIRAKQQAKPKGIALPIDPSQPKPTPRDASSASAAP